MTKMKAVAIGDRYAPKDISALDRYPCQAIACGNYSEDGRTVIVYVITDSVSGKQKLALWMMKVAARMLRRNMRVTPIDRFEEEFESEEKS